MPRKKVIIVGAGISGLTAGIYCLDQGFDVEIYEKNPVPGGECVGWTRKGTYIEGCAHWIIGTSPKSDLYPLWNHIGIFDGDPQLFQTRYISKFELKNGDTLTLYSDLHKLESELLRVAPEDKKAIRRLIKGIRAYMHTRIPVDRPIDKMNLFQLMKFGAEMLPMFMEYTRARRESMEHFAARFQNENIRDVLTRFLEPEYNVHACYYILQELAKGNSCVIEGGSSAMMERIAKRFTSQGGILHLASPVKEILIENDKAVGIKTEKGEEIRSDYVISACDMHYALRHLLGAQYVDKEWEKQYANREAFPVNTSVLLSYRAKGDFHDFPYQIDFPAEEFSLFGKKTNHFPLRNFAFDSSLPTPEGTTLFTALIPANQEVYESLKQMDRKEYVAKKQELGESFIPLIAKKLSIPEEDVELLDVATPLTYERYNHCYKGSYMAFLSTAKGWGLMRPGLVKGLSNFVMAGQWIMIPGGLPIALMAGKHAAIRICNMEKVKFQNKEETKREK